MDYVIVRVTEEPNLKNGEATADMRVEFTVGKDGPFYERFPKADFNPGAVGLRLGQFARDLAQMRGNP